MIGKIQIKDLAPDVRTSACRFTVVGLTPENMTKAWVCGVQFWSHTQRGS